MNLALELPRRDWIYASTPPQFEIPPCPKCGTELQWSTFKGKCWCSGCTQDIVPEHFGIIDGPVPVNAAQMLGFDLGAIDLRVVQYVPFSAPSWPYSPLFPKEKAKHLKQAALRRDGKLCKPLNLQ